MASEVDSEGNVLYALRLDEDTFELNCYLGSTVSLSYSGNISCIHCGRKTRKSYSQGYCYPCFKKLAQCDLCVVSPERCHFDQGTCRDNDFAENFCMQPHIVYLANSSGIKVGITKPENLPTRWIDQGAVQAIPILKVKTRQQSGFVEEVFREHVSDKTQWQQMLKVDDQLVDLVEARDELMQLVKPGLDQVGARFGIQAIQPLPEAKVQSFNYPVDQYPTKVASLSFDKTPKITGQLLGIKGQYLILNIGVLNLRRFTSYEVEFSVQESPTDEPAGQLSLL